MCVCFRAFRFVCVYVRVLFYVFVSICREVVRAERVLVAAVVAHDLVRQRVEMPQHAWNVHARAPMPVPRHPSVAALDARGLGVDVRTMRMDELGCNKGASGWDCAGAMNVMGFCNGPVCPQSPTAMRAMIRDGFPADKIYYYRGGMLDWDALGLTTVEGEF